LIGEPHHLIALSLQPRSAGRVVFLLRTVRLAIHFNYQAAGRAEEIHDEAVNWVLPPKLVAGQVAIPQTLPESPLGWGLWAAKLTRTLQDSWTDIVVVGRHRVQSLAQG
jgi:hypothetical protein